MQQPSAEHEECQRSLSPTSERERSNEPEEWVTGAGSTHRNSLLINQCDGETQKPNFVIRAGELNNYNVMSV